MPTKFIATGCSRPTSFETTNASDAQSAATPSRAKEPRPKSVDPGWKKTSAEPPNAITEPARARASRCSIRCATARSSVKSGPIETTTAATPAVTSCIAKYIQPYAAANASNPYTTIRASARPRGKDSRKATKSTPKTTAAPAKRRPAPQIGSSSRLL